MIQMIQNKINYLGSKLPATSSTTYFSTSRTQFDIPLQYIKGNVSNSLERFDRNINDFDEFPKINIERKFTYAFGLETKSRHQQNNAFMGLPSYSSSTFSINPLNTISNMPRSMQASNKNLMFSRNPSVESRHHLKMQNSDESKQNLDFTYNLDNIMVNDYNEFSENMDSNIR